MSNQYELGVMSSLKADISEVPRKWVEICGTKAEAYRLTMNQSLVLRSDSNWADLLGLTKGHLSQILNHKADVPKYMPPRCEVELMRLSGNRAFCQWVEMAAKGQLVCQQSAEKQIEIAKEHFQRMA